MHYKIQALNQQYPIDVSELNDLIIKISDRLNTDEFKARKILESFFLAFRGALFIQTVTLKGIGIFMIKGKKIKAKLAPSFKKELKNVN